MYFGGLLTGNGSLSLSNKLITKLKEKNNVDHQLINSSLFNNKKTPFIIKRNLHKRKSDIFNQLY